MDSDKLPVIVATLKATQLFSALDQAELDAFAARAVMRGFASGEMLFSEGEPCTGLFCIVAGRVRVFKTSAAGREQVLTIEGPGSSIAEVPVFDGGPYPASASAAGDVQTVFVSRHDFRVCCLEHPDVSLKVLQVMSARLRRLVGIIEELSFTTLRHRLIAWLLREAEANGRPTPDGTIFEIGMTHQELAAHIGTVRELVSRNLARLQAQGAIQIQGREITITDRESLEADLASVL